MSLLTQLPEDFLHHVWNTCNFDLHNLKTLCGAPIFIRTPGIWNHNQGPDFLNARLQIDGIAWFGQVELHVLSQDWYRHGHHLDPAYNNTILHVVLTSNGKQIFREDGTAIPELVLQDRIEPSLLHRYKYLQLAEASIPCQSQLPTVSPACIQENLIHKGIERMQEKADQMRQRLKDRIQDWEQILWEEILSMMGGPVNRDVFRDLAKRVPIKKLRKQQEDLKDIEALLFGASGMLSGGSQKDDYHHELKTRWSYLKEKLNISCPFPLDIRFMRMRPASFPGIRISQSVCLLQAFPLLSHLLAPKGYEKLLATPIPASQYWESHYRFFEVCTPKPKQLGSTQKALLISNTLLPMSLLYQEAHRQVDANALIQNTLTQLAAEKNRITRSFEALGWKNPHALASQGMIHLKKSYCQKRRCLHCEIGKEILA